MGYFGAMFTSTMAFFKNSQATTKCDAERNWSTSAMVTTSSIARPKIGQQLERWVTWVHVNFRVHITDKLVTDFWGSGKLQFAHTLSWFIKSWTSKKVQNNKIRWLFKNSLKFVIFTILKIRKVWILELCRGLTSLWLTVRSLSLVNPAHHGVCTVVQYAVIEAMTRVYGKTENLTSSKYKMAKKYSNAARNIWLCRGVELLCKFQTKSAHQILLGK